MIAIDTNVLLRYVLDDDLEQSHAARELLWELSSENQAFICREVLIETVWVLERAYGFTRGAIASMLDQLLVTEGLVVEGRDSLANALASYVLRQADFADVLILEAARREESLPLYTFDRKLSRMDGAALLPVAR